MLEAAKQVLADFAAKGFPELSIRKVHYEVGQHHKPRLRNKQREWVTYSLTNNCYQRLDKVLLAARHQGIIRWNQISDDTRPFISWAIWDNPQDFVTLQFEKFLSGYKRNLLQSQSDYFIVLGEKSTIGQFIQPVCAEYQIPILLQRGFCSGRPLYEVVERFRKSGCKRLVPLLMTDFDPPGQEINNNVAFYMEKIHKVPCYPIQVGIKANHVQEFNLPSGGKAKPASPGYQRFVDTYGHDIRELESMQTADLQAILRSAIDSVLDVEAFNREVRQSYDDNVSIDHTRAEIMAAARGIVLKT